MKTILYIRDFTEDGINQKIAKFHGLGIFADVMYTDILRRDNINSSWHTMIECEQDAPANLYTDMESVAAAACTMAKVMSEMTRRFSLFFWNTPIGELNAFDIIIDGDFYWKTTAIARSRANNSDQIGKRGRPVSVTLEEMVAIGGRLQSGETMANVARLCNKNRSYLYKLFHGNGLLTERGAELVKSLQ